MQIDPESKQKIQLVLAIAIAVAAVRAGYIVYQRHSGKTKEAQKKELPLNPDYYVSPKKLYPFDLKSARQLMNQPVWVKKDTTTRTTLTIRRIIARISRTKRERSYHCSVCRLRMSRPMSHQARLTSGR